MSLLDRWRRPALDTEPLLDPPAEPPALPVEAPRATRSLRVLRADGQRVDLTARNAGTRLSLVRQDWQMDAWSYRDMIGELRYAQRLLARSVAKVRFYAAELRDFPDDPAELSGTDHKLDPRLAADAVANLNRLPLDDGPDGFIATLTENLITAGEAWIHGEPDDGDGEQWNVRSVSEIVGAGDQVMLAELPTTSTMGQRVIDPSNEELLRCWMRHPRWGQLADSPLRAMLDVLEEVVLSGREMRAAARSRIASNGVLLLPNSLALLRTRDDDESLVDQGVLENEFMRDFTEALTAPIRNEGDAGAVVPLVLRGDAEALKEVRHLTLARDDAVKLMERVQGAILRMLQGLDIQPEQVQGLGATNHWTGWSIEAGSIRHQVIPTAAIVAGCLTKAFQRPALTALGYSPSDVRRIVVWYDASALVESPDRAQDARDAWDRDVISNVALRESLGFDPDDEPDGHEHLVRLLTKGRLTPEAVPLVAALSGISLTDPVLKQALAISVGLATKAQTQVVPGVAHALPAGQSANPAQPAQVVPEQIAPAQPTGSSPTGQPGSVTASGVMVDMDAVRALVDIDTTLTERIMVAGDAAVYRAVERAGGRVRNAVRGDHALTASLKGVDTALVASTIGRGTLSQFTTVPDLLAGSCVQLEERVDEWLASAGESAASLTVRLLNLDAKSPVGLDLARHIAVGFVAHRRNAVTELTEIVNAKTEQVLFGEHHGGALVTRADVTRVLATAGGVGTGPLVQYVFATNGGARAWDNVMAEADTRDRIRAHRTKESP